MTSMNQDKYAWLSGVVVPLVILLTENEELDATAMEKIIRRQLDAVFY